MDNVREYRPYTATPTAHNGQPELGRYAQPGVFLKGRDRSRKAVLKEETALKRPEKGELDSRCYSIAQ